MSEFGPQWFLDTFPSPGYVYGLLQGENIIYIGRTFRIDQRIREHERNGRVFDSYQVLATVTPGYLVAEMEARWLSHGLQQGWPLTNKEAQYEHLQGIFKRYPKRDYFTCPIGYLPCGDLIIIQSVRSSEQHLSAIAKALGVSALDLLVETKEE